MRILKFQVTNSRSMMLLLLIRRPNTGVYFRHRETLFNRPLTAIEKVFFKFAYNQLCGLHSNSSDLAHLADFRADFKQRIS